MEGTALQKIVLNEMVAMNESSVMASGIRRWEAAPKVCTHGGYEVV